MVLGKFQASIYGIPVAEFPRNIFLIVDVYAFNTTKWETHKSNLENTSFAKKYIFQNSINSAIVSERIVYQMKELSNPNQHCPIIKQNLELWIEY